MMRDCEDGNMRDLLPGYARGTIASADRARVLAHLLTCADCATELELIEAASRAFPAPNLDVSQIIRALPSAPRGSRRPFFATRIGQLAAAVGIMAVGAISVLTLRGYFGGDTTVIVVGGRNVAAADTAKRSIVPTNDTATVAVAPAPARDSSRSKASGSTGLSFGGGLSDLTDDQLDTLLGELGALDAMPSAEPESHLTPIVPPADGGHSAR
jgi:anti-sigma factor RsiW